MLKSLSFVPAISETCACMLVHLIHISFKTQSSASRPKAAQLCLEPPLNWFKNRKNENEEDKHDYEHKYVSQEAKSWKRTRNQWMHKEKEPQRLFHMEPAI